MADSRSVLGWIVAAGCATAVLAAAIVAPRHDGRLQSQALAPAASQKPAGCSACDAAKKFQTWAGYTPAFNEARRELAAVASLDLTSEEAALARFTNLALGVSSFPGVDGREEAVALRVLALEALVARATSGEPDAALTDRCIEVATALAYDTDMSLRLAAANAACALVGARRVDWSVASADFAAMIRDLAEDEDLFVRVAARATGPSQ
ncbi:MAG: hypothetical protein IT439_09300 [Phycisphaerales bacterium]|nr:hypothetical protein [Phycisphaerales bacterium]